MRPPTARRLGSLLADLLTPAGALGALLDMGEEDDPLEVTGEPTPRRRRQLDPATAILSSNGPARDPKAIADPLGRKTLGAVSVAELADAQREGTLRINKAGTLTTPGPRTALKELRQAGRRVANSGANIQALAAEFPELSPRWLRALGRAQRKTGTPAPLLAGILGIESDYGRSTLPGVHSGQNFAGAAGPFQIGNGTGEAGDAWSQVAEEVWGPRASQHSIYDVEDAALGAGQYLQTFPARPATKNPQTWYDAAFSYNHADWYAQDVVANSQRFGRLNRLGRPPDPGAVQSLQLAKRNARAEGINPTRFNGDVAGGGPTYTMVRAGAKGMVDWVESAVGVQEGSPKQLGWAGKTGLGGTEPWCANFVSVGLMRRGITDLPSNPNYVPSYEAEWSKYAVKGGLAKAKLGDLLTFGSHIGVYVGNGEMVSGNSSDAVSRTDAGSPTMVLRPPYKGGKVRVEDSQLPGSSAASALGGGIGGVAPGVAAPAAGGGLGGSRPSVALTQLTAPLSAGPVLPEAYGGAVEGEPESAADSILALLGEENPLGRRRPVI